MITIYGTSTCPWCDKAKQLITSYGDEYEFILLDSKTIPEFQRLFPGYKSVPQMIARDPFCPDLYIHGYEALEKYYER